MTKVGNRSDNLLLSKAQPPLTPANAASVSHPHLSGPLVCLPVPLSFGLSSVRGWRSVAPRRSPSSLDLPAAASSCTFPHLRVRRRARLGVPALESLGGAPERPRGSKKDLPGHGVPSGPSVIAPCVRDSLSVSVFTPCSVLCYSGYFSLRKSKLLREKKRS